MLSWLVTPQKPRRSPRKSEPVPSTLKNNRRKYVEGLAVLDAELEQGLVFGVGTRGRLTLELRSREDWERHWATWRSVLEPKVAEHLPGFRAVAQYVIDEIPDRPVLQAPPLRHDFARFYVGDSAGEGRWICRYPPPWMQTEPQWLREIGVVSDHEWSRYRQKRIENHEYATAGGRSTYPLEQGAYW
jgi:hypothetical protein